MLFHSWIAWSGTFFLSYHISKTGLRYGHNISKILVTYSHGSLFLVYVIFLLWVDQWCFSSHPHCSSHHSLKCCWSLRKWSEHLRSLNALICKLYVSVFPLFHWPKKVTWSHPTSWQGICHPIMVPKEDPEKPEGRTNDYYIMIYYLCFFSY